VKIILLTPLASNRMNFSDTYETPLRSYIQNRTETLQNTIEEVVRNRPNIETAQLERQIDRETDKFIADITGRLHRIRDDIKAHRPQDNREPDYETRMAQYRQLLESSSTGVNQVTNWIQKIFDKVISTVKTIIQWIVDNAQTIVRIIEQIRDAFKLISTIFIRH
jgi:hypothetical protein